MIAPIYIVLIISFVILSWLYLTQENIIKHYFRGNYFSASDLEM